MNTNGKTIYEDALVLVHLRNIFYQKKFRYALGIFLLSLTVNIVLLGIIIYLVKNPTEPLYFPSDKVGRLLQDIPVEQPNMSIQDVSAWAIEAVQAAYSYDFVNYHAQLQDAQKYFTTYGWQNYMKALGVSNNFRALTQRKFVVVAKVVGDPKLITQGILGGASAWKFEMPMLVSYLSPPFNDKSRFDNPLIVTVVVQRQDLLQSYRGLGILQLIANIATTPSQNLAP
ncbi:MAG: DotI/IcmL/TraM family protein [Gammaproteobacteria bacterium]